MVRIHGLASGGDVVAGGAKDEFKSRFAALLKDSGLQAKNVARRVNARRGPGASWNVTEGLLSAWKNGRNLPSTGNQSGFLQTVRFLTEQARGRAVRGHAAGHLLDEVEWTRLLEQARAAPIVDDSQRTEIAAYLKALIGWLDVDPWPQYGHPTMPVLKPALLERKLQIAIGNGPQRQYLDADALTGRCARLVVLGPPGSGKTWLAKRSARLCAMAALSALTDGSEIHEIELPLYTTCVRLAAVPPGDHLRHAIVSSAFSQFPDLGGTRMVDSLRDLFENRNGPTLLVIDSLDETHSADDRIRQADTLPSSWRIMLTSRPAAWYGQLTVSDSDPSRRVGFLQPLKYPDDVERFIAAWFGDRPDQVASLTAQIRDRPDLRQASTVPLILTFYCIIGGGRPLPERRTDLYATVVRRILSGRWRGYSNPGPDPEVCITTLRKWAWSAATAHPLSEVGNWADEFPTAWVRRSQDDRDALDRVAAPLQGPDEDTGITLRRFVHRSVHEYLVAQHIGLHLGAKQAAGELVKHIWYDPDWEYAAPAALAVHPKRDQVLLILMHHLTRGDPPSFDLSVVDGCWEFRRFLARAAQESREDDWSPSNGKIIGQARIELVMSRPGDISEVVAEGWPTSNRRILDWLLGQLAVEKWHWLTPRLANGVTGLDPSANDRERARQVLLSRLATPASKIGRHDAEVLADTLGGLAVTIDEQAATRQALLDLLVLEANPEIGAALTRALARLNLSVGERARAREELLRLLADQAEPHMAHALAEALGRLAVTPEDQTHARRVIVDFLRSQIDPRRAQTLGYAMAELGPAPGDWEKARQALLRLLDDQPAWGIWALAQAIARLSPPAEELARVRRELLSLFPAQEPRDAPAFAKMITNVDPTGSGPEWVRQEALGLLVSQNDLWDARALAEVVAILNPTAEERQLARQKIFELLPGEIDEELVGEIDEEAAKAMAEVAAQLAVTVEEREWTASELLSAADLAMPESAAALAEIAARLNPAEWGLALTRECLLSQLSLYVGEWGAWRLVAAFAELNPTAEDRRRARQALINGIDGGDDYVGGWLAFEVAGLAVTAEERVQARQELLRRLADGPHPDIGPWLAVKLARLAVTAEDRAQARQELLRQLADEKSKWAIQDLAEELAQLAATAQEKEQARQVLLGLTVKADRRKIWNPIDVLAELAPTVAELGSWEGLPIAPNPALLAAMRRNSSLSAWLYALPSLSRLLLRPYDPSGHADYAQ
jgi:hypothetical protein